MASFFFASDSSRSSRLRSSSSAATRAGTSSIGTRNSEAVALASAAEIVGVVRARLRRSAPRCGARRTATPASPTTRDEADVAGALAHACRRTIRPTSPWCCRRLRPWRRRAPRRRISRRTARARRRRCASSRLSSRVIDRRILQHDVVGDILDALDLLGAHRLRMREIETQAIGRDQRALLRHVIAEHLPQRLVQKMRRRMILPDGAAPARDRPQAQARRRP